MLNHISLEFVFFSDFIYISASLHLKAESHSKNYEYKAQLLLLNHTIGGCCCFGVTELLLLSWKLHQAQTK